MIFMVKMFDKYFLCIIIVFEIRSFGFNDLVADWLSWGTPWGSFADVVELVDTSGLGPDACKKRGGSSPLVRTIVE